MKDEIMLRPGEAVGRTSIAFYVNVFSGETIETAISENHHFATHCEAAKNDTSKRKAVLKVEVIELEHPGVHV